MTAYNHITMAAILIPIVVGSVVGTACLAYLFVFELRKHIQKRKQQ